MTNDESLTQLYNRKRELYEGIKVRNMLGQDTKFLKSQLRIVEKSIEVYEEG